ncbi:MAG: NUDIX domain-containing protein, partial [Myxococcota bacterium]
MGHGKQSAGILLFRRTAGTVDVFLVHPGGPYFARKDAGVWSLPKGEVEADEDPLDVAFREFAEETGQSVETCAPSAPPRSLGTVRQRGRKVVAAWAVEGDWPPGAELVSNTFEIEWPPRSGRRRRFPEVDRGGFFRSTRRSTPPRSSYSIGCWRVSTQRRATLRLADLVETSKRIARTRSRLEKVRADREPTRRAREGRCRMRTQGLCPTRRGAHTVGRMGDARRDRIRRRGRARVG